MVPAKVYQLQFRIYEDTATAHFLTCSFHCRQLKYTKAKDTRELSGLFLMHIIEYCNVIKCMYKAHHKSREVLFKES